MALGQVQINRLNLMQGPVTEYERYMIFIGAGNGTNEGKLLRLNSDSDLDEQLGQMAYNLKTQIETAKLNAGQNWSAAALPLSGGDTWSDGVDYAMTQTNAEAIVITDTISTSPELEAMQTKAKSILSMYMRPLWFCAAIAGCDTDPTTGHTWADYLADVSLITGNLSCDHVSVVPQLFGYDQGAYVGRLCNRAVTVADTPMRVATGPLVGTWSVLPKDKNDLELDRATLDALDKERYSVPQWYPDYPGMFWGDGNLLDAPGGDYQTIEHLRVVQKAMRRVYPLAVGRIANRQLNSTPASIESNKTYFMRPLLEMSKSADVFGTVFPGEIHPPTDDSIDIIWDTKTSVSIYLSLRPYNCPKIITVNLALDLTNYA